MSSKIQLQGAALYILATALNQHAYLRSSTIPYDTIRDPATLTRFRPIFQTDVKKKCYQSNIDFTPGISTKKSKLSGL
jgi:hypothetical protein